MSELEDKENEEYRKRIRDLAERLEKDKDKESAIGEQQVIEAKEQLLQTAKSGIHPYYRREMIIMVFVYTIRDYYKKRADSTEKEQFQKEIDALYKLIFEELIKPSPNIHPSDPKFKKKVEKLDRKRILKNMTRILGMENLFRDFYKHYDIKEATRTDLCTKEILWCVLTIICGTSVILYFFWRYFILP